MALSRQQQFLTEIETRINKDLLPALKAQISVPTATIVNDLKRLGLTMHTHGCQLDELNSSANALAKRSSKKALWLGAAGSLFGQLSLPPELAAGLIQQLRHSQRLGVVYGFDPHTEKGRLLVWKSLGAAYQVPVPQQGLMDLRFDDIKKVSQSSTENLALSALLRSLAGASIKAQRRKFGRYVPGVGLVIGARESKRRLMERHERMMSLYQEAWLELHGTLGAHRKADEI